MAVLALSAGLCLAQEAPRLFAPVPATQSAPVTTATPPPQVRTTLEETPVPQARPEVRPAPDIRSTLGDDDAPPPAPSPRPSIVYAPQRIAFADGVSGQFDIPYATLAGFRPLTLDLYTPRASAMPLPMVLFIHGGGWNSGDSKHALPFTDFPRALAGLAARGYVVASMNYRLSQEARFPAALQDVKTAIRWLRSHATDFNGDVTRIAVWGASAGGQLATMAGATCGVPRFQPQDTSMESPSDCPEAVIDWFGPTDLASLAADNGKPAKDGFTPVTPTSEEGAYLGCEPSACAPGVVRLTSPMAFLSENAPPFLIQHGAADTTVSPKQAQKLYDALKQKGVPAQIVLYPGAEHGFRKGGAPDTAIVAQAMERLVSFLSSTFPNKPINRPAPDRTGPQIRRTVAN
jgi:acetyl esterase/lipase